MNQLYTDRLARVCSRLREQGLTQMIVSDPLSIGYLTGVWIKPYERLFAFYIRTDGKHIFFLNNLFVIPDIDVTKVWMSDTDDCIGIVTCIVDAGSDMGMYKSCRRRFLFDLLEGTPGVRDVDYAASVDKVRYIKAD